MIIELVPNINTQYKEAIFKKIERAQHAFTEVKTQTGHYIVSNNGTSIEKSLLEGLEGIKKIYNNPDQYKLVAKNWKSSPTEIKLFNNAVISQNSFSIMAGPCAIESEQQIDLLIDHAIQNNIQIIRGGVFKPRTSPYSFQGLGISALKALHKKAQKHNIAIISEVMEISQIELMYDCIDIFQVGARNSQNFNLLNALGKVDKPVLLKRGISGMIDELLHAAEYVYKNGNEQIILCERGIRTYEKAYRNTFDLNAVPILKDKTHLPVIIDPSHGVGIKKYVPAMALAGIMGGADGVLLEVHPSPTEALSDGEQSLDFEMASDLYRKMSATYDLRKSF